MNADYKWSEKSIRQEFKDQDERIRPNFNRVRKYQHLTDDLSECVMWCINSIRNDREQRRRELDHGTGAE
jgi:hypothetical protein